MARNIIIDVDTEVGYSYLRKKFYLSNKGTTTYRDTAEDIKEILDIVAPDSGILLDNLKELEITLEKVKNVYYTWSATGSFIESIQFNTYREHILVLDCLKKKLYFTDSTLLFDLKLNERKKDRINLMISFLKSSLGMEVTEKDMGDIYDLLISYYTPRVYNVLSKKRSDDGDLVYSKEFRLKNYSGLSRAEYTCTFNPNDELYYTDSTNVIRMGGVHSTITLLNEAPYKIGDRVAIKGSLDETGTFTNDGEYTVTGKDHEYLTLSPQIPYVIDIGYPNLKLITSTLEVDSVNRETFTITCASPIPNTMQVGDIVYLDGTKREEDYETVSADGKYTIASISGSTITVQEAPSISYTYTTGAKPKLSRHAEFGRVIKVEDKVLTMKNNLRKPLQEGDVIEYIKGDIPVLYTVVSATEKTITVLENIPNYIPVYPTIEKVFPVPNILINVLSTKRPDKFPEGEFMVDNFEQCVQYIGTYTTLTKPSQENIDNVNKKVPKSIKINSTLPKLELLGTFQEVYNS